MKRARKSNRVSWATGANLCQVKLFLSEECPSKVGQKSQDHLQAKTSSMLLSSANESNDLPPGFEGNHFLTQSKVEFSLISQIKWECPPQFIFSHHWRIAAGEESREKEDQKLREMRVLEAVYPRLSAIPPSPSISLDVEEEDYDDNLTPLIPLIPIEEEESMDILPELAVAVDPPTNLQSQNLQLYISATTPISSDSKNSHSVPSPACANPLSGMSPGMEADLAAASAVVAAIMKSNEQGSLIDMDLLVKIFNDPIMIEKLINEHRTAATTGSTSSNTLGIPTSGLKPASSNTLGIPTSGLKPASSNTLGIPTSGLKPAIPLSTPTPDAATSGITPTSTVGLLPSGLRPANLPVSLLKPTLDQPATVSVPTMQSVSLLTATHEKPATTSVPLSRPMPGKPATPSISLPTPTPAPHMHRLVNKNVNRKSNGMPPALNAQPPQDKVLASGVKRAASLASISSNELNSVPLPSATGNLHAVVNQVQSTASIMPYQLGTGSAFAVKDASYYKNLIRQHGADKQDIHHSNFQDLKLVHNIKQGEVKHKIQKQCIYFKSSRGCRNGSNCPYLHDMPVQWGAGNGLGAQNAKRLKLGPEI